MDHPLGSSDSFNSGDKPNSRLGAGFSRVREVWRSFPRGQKVSVASLFLIALLILPVSVFVSLQQTKTRSRAQVPVTPVTPPGVQGFNQALVLDGNSYIKIPSAASMPDLQGSFTIEMRFLPSANTNGDLFKTLLQKVGVGGVEYQLLLKQHNNNSSSIFFSVPNHPAIEGSIIFPNNGSTWRHVAIVKTGPTIKILFDGALDAETTLQNTPPSSTSYPLLIGASLTNGGELLNQFSGQIDELRISSKAVYYTAGRPPSNPFIPGQDTLVLYHFDANTNDSSGNNVPAVPFGNIQYTKTATIPPTGLCPTTVTFPNADYFGLVKINNNNAPFGTIIRIYNSGNNLVGCGNVNTANGTYPFTKVYNTAQGEQLTFWVNNDVGNTTPTPVTFVGGARTQVDINTGQISTPAPTSAGVQGDINGDGTINIQDYILLSNAFGTSNSPADLNSDGRVDILDYIILSNNFGRTSP